MPPSKEDIAFQRKVDALRRATGGLLKPDVERGRALAENLALIAAQNAERAA
jgi:hypothetical protein